MYSNTINNCDRFYNQIMVAFTYSFFCQAYEQYTILETIASCHEVFELLNQVKLKYTLF